MITQSTKRSLAFLLVLLMVVSAVPMQVFAADATAPVFLVDSGETVTGLNEAMEKASKTVVLMNDATLPAGDYIIPAGKTLLIPYDASNTLCTDKPTVVENYTKPSAYRTLTMASGAKIIVNGALSVSGSQACGNPVTASASGPLGFINMAEGSNITVNSAANLYVWGYITGSGTVTIKNGGTVYEDFQLSNWRGGQASVSMINNSQRVFMMSQYYIQNVEVPMTLEAGAKEFGCISVNLSDFGIQQSAVPFIGPEGMFNVTEGSLVKDYIENQDRLQITMQGKVQMKNLTMKISLYTINSKKYELPVNSNITVRVKSGAATTVTQNLAMLPGTEMYIEKGANVQLGNGVSLYFYDRDEWMAGNYSSHSSKFDPVKYAPGRTYTRTTDDLKDAYIYVEGEMDASQGYVYTTDGGANITAAKGASIKLKPGTQTNTYQATQGTHSDTPISYVSIPITPAKLKNADGTYTETASLPLGQYTYSNGTWAGVCLHIKDEKVTTAATCTVDGVKIISCACGFSETEKIPATGHSWQNATCTVPKTCSVCKASEGGTIPHTFDQEKVDPKYLVSEATCTEQAVYKKSCACGEAGTETFKYGNLKDHVYNQQKVDPKYLVSEATSSSPAVYYKSCVCGKAGTETFTSGDLKKHVYDQEKVDPKYLVSEATCTEQAVYYKSCNCGEAGTETFKYGNLKNHVYDQQKVDPKYLVSEATTTEKAVYKKSCKCGAAGEETFTAGNLKPQEFKDVPQNAYFHDAVMWAVENGVTSGTGDGTTFEPNAICTRGQVVTFLWRAAGEPEPATAENPFVDVKSSDYFYKAVLWAKENNVTSGTGDGTTFEPNTNCNRAQIVTFLSRAKNGQPTTSKNPFKDVAENAYYYNPVLWAVEKGITTGTGDGTTFAPNEDCTRGQVITFLWRAYTK